MRSHQFYASQLHSTLTRAPLPSSLDSITTYNKSTKSYEMKQILTTITGQALAGQMVAIMGPTGSGKTSLLNVLAMRCPIVKGGDLTGSFKVNGEGE